MLRTVLAAALLAVFVGPVRAEVVDSSSSGFSIRIATAVDAPPEMVFKALTQSVGSWWSSQHTYSGSAANLGIDARPGGCFCETWSGGAVRHMTVTHVLAPTTLVLNGGLGPLGTMAVAGAMEWTLKAQGGRTELAVTYNVGGYTPGGFAPLAPAVDAVLAEQVTRLKRFIETGRPQ
ncbi:MAG: SRPBCC domain-containing protein [Acidobacteria bacterium]|nr:SRPBCC domain-containing protein [Acidobacteriota bacterium]